MSYKEQIESFIKDVSFCTCKEKSYRAIFKAIDCDNKRDLAEYIVKNGHDMFIKLMNMTDKSIDYPEKQKENIKWIYSFINSKNYIEYTAARDLISKQLIDLYNDSNSQSN